MFLCLFLFTIFVFLSILFTFYDFICAIRWFRSAFTVSLQRQTHKNHGHINYCYFFSRFIKKNAHTHTFKSFIEFEHDLNALDRYIKVCMLDIRPMLTAVKHPASVWMCVFTWMRMCMAWYWHWLRKYAKNFLSPIDCVWTRWLASQQPIVLLANFRPVLCFLFFHFSISIFFCRTNMLVDAVCQQIWTSHSELVPVDFSVSA